MNGKWLKPKAESEDDSEKNPFEAAGMDGAMEGMKKQAVMMYVHSRPLDALHNGPLCIPDTGLIVFGSAAMSACLPCQTLDDILDDWDQADVQGSKHDHHAIHQRLLLRLHPQYVHPILFGVHLYLGINDQLTSLVKLPFPLTLGFKSLLSRDIVMPDLDARWVS